MIITKAFKYRIYPTREQREFFARHFGACRFVYNYFLDLRSTEYKENRRSIPGLECKRMLVPLKAGNTWLKEMNSQSLQEAVLNLDRAYQGFFRGLAKYPAFKKKRGPQSFAVPQHFRIDGQALHIPKLRTGIRMKLHRPMESIPSSLVVSCTASGKYYVSFVCEAIVPERNNRPAATIGIDLGLTSFIATSEGEKIASPRHLGKSEERLARLQRSLSRKKKGSRNKNRQRIKVALLHEKVANQRQDFLHKLSRKIVDENQTVYLEDLNVKGMIRNRHLSKSIADAGWSEFTRQLEYKGEWCGTRVVRIGRFYPSTRTCSVCGFVNRELTLKARSWLCPSCGVVHDRDINAAQVIKKVGQDMPDIKPVEKKTSVLSFKRKDKFSSVKQEARASFEMHGISIP
ncbi:MAG: transposase [Syntrophorhabdaceae bacterium]|nr:transposase [Syntrophorhabdaceae bacterium]